MTLIEGMAAGAAVLASDIGAFRRVLADGRFGRQFANRDPAALAAAAVGLLADEAGRRALAEAGSAGRLALRLERRLRRGGRRVSARHAQFHGQGRAAMTLVDWILGVALVLVLFASALVNVAHRLDRLNLRVQAAAETLRASRAHRSGAALELATSGSLDPAGSLLLADAAHRARAALDGWSDGDLLAPEDLDARVGRAAQAETDLTEAIRAVAAEVPAPAGAGPADAFADLDRAGLMLSMARRLYNDAAAQCTQLHAARIVRWFRLAGRSGPPPTLDFDDAGPALGPGEGATGR